MGKKYKKIPKNSPNNPTSLLTCQDIAFSGYA